ncbi:MAG: non-heme bromoperoxidase BpoC [Acidimicrobiia bacterium]|nr:MAG: non-heme bromoperoxidase BpoC [Acidimicrobiia bacterium]
MAGPLPHWRSGTVGSGGEDVYFEVTGDDGAPAVVLTHGAGGSHAAWYQQVPALAAAGYRVVTWDSRGFGRSSYRTGVHGPDAAAADLAAVMDELGIVEAHHVGQSMGGWWVTAFALAHPTRVRSLTLSNTVAGCWTDALRDHFRHWAGDFTAGESRLGIHPAIGRDLVARDPAKAFLYQQLNTFHAPPMTEIVVALWRMRIEPEQLGALRVPVLVVTGADDGLFPPALVRAGLSRIDGARVVELPGAGHSPYFERPDEYNAVLLDFLGPADRISSQ